ncbi:hypothetical protein B0H63DRAFT_444704 [Podospora didyma]|uniref:BHLH domain-containing protein n=1 Tax=Podospora didyma TaxID=330526 RepID=A0AAE0P7S6_9PEZI|nr:hypothetical protein B0H63DRAFT_444704 [Podospora didyma]
MSSSSPTRGEAASQEERPRLTEEEKKANHILSEQKRRQAIREGFDKLANTVPGLQGQGRSEGMVLQGTLKFIREQLERLEKNIMRMEEAGRGHEVSKAHREFMDQLAAMRKDDPPAQPKNASQTRASGSDGDVDADGE